jgi:hypothetical protein
VEKVRLDYARILIATPALEVVNRVEKLLVEGELVEIKIVEEWGLALGEDACLYDNEPESETYHSDNEAAHCDPEASNNVDMLVDKIAKEAATDMERVMDKDKQNSSSVSRVPTSQVNSATQHIPVREGVDHILEPVEEPIVDHPEKNPNSPCHDSSLGGKLRSGATAHPSKRSKSCPPGVTRSVVSGPWSLEWLHDHNHGGAGVIFSTKKRPKGVERSGPSQGHKAALEHKKRKVDGSFRHSSLKKVARLPCRDRKEVLKNLKRNVRRRSGRNRINRSCTVKSTGPSEEAPSSASINNDWQNWVVMHGSEKMAVEDVWGIGKAIGVKFTSDNANRFRALVRAGKGKQPRVDAARGENEGQ